MGKRILAQRKGHGNLWARSPSHRHVGEVKYRPFKSGEDNFKFKVQEFIHSPGRGAPVAIIKYNDGVKDLWLPPEGIYEGQEFIHSKSGPIEVGNILPLKEMPLGTLVFNIESTPLDGGKFARASGVAAIVRNKTKNQVELLFRSKKSKWIHPTYNGILEVYRAKIGSNWIMYQGFDYGPCSYSGKVFELTDFFQSSIWTSVQGFYICFYKDMPLTEKHRKILYSLDKIFLKEVNNH